jgi:hypothetical protein
METSSNLAGRLYFTKDNSLYVTVGDPDRICCDGSDDNSLRIKAKKLNNDVGRPLVSAGRNYTGDKFPAWKNSLRDVQQSPDGYIYVATERSVRGDAGPTFNALSSTGFSARFQALRALSRLHPPSLSASHKRPVWEGTSYRNPAPR